MAPDTDDPQSVGAILDRLDDAGSDVERALIGDIVQAFGSRSYGPFLLVPALIEISPLGGIPGLPTVLAAIIVLFAAQMLFGRKHIWLPQFIGRRSVSKDRLKRATQKLRPLAGWLDRWFHGRLEALTKGPFIRLAAAACILLALTVPPLELIPFASTAPMGAIAMFGLALLVRDGVLMIAAILAAVLAIGVGLWALFTGG